MIFNPKEMAADVERFAKALRVAPVQRFDELPEDFAKRVARWHKDHEEAVEMAYNTVWVDEIKNLLLDHKTYSDKH